MLNLDGAALNMDGVEFEYEIPEPFGPDRGPAYLKIKARPAASTNKPYRAALDEIMHQARVKDFEADKKYEASKDADAYMVDRDAAVKWVSEQMASLNLKHCVISWETNIQNSGKDLEATDENFLELSRFEHPDLRAAFKAFQSDLMNRAKFAVEASKAAAEEEAKN